MKRILRSSAFLGAFAAVLAFAGHSAHAGLIITSVVGGSATGANYANFDDLTTGASGGLTSVVGPTSSTLTVSFTGDGQAVTGSVGGLYAAPYLSANNATNFGNTPTTGQDQSVYLTTGIGSVALNFSSHQDYFGLLWGSIDGYNSLEFFDGVTSVGLLTGSDVAVSANGDQGVNGTYYVNIHSTLLFDRVVASSTNYAFEFDNVAFDLRAVPEPGSIALIATGIGGWGLMMRRRRGRAKSDVSKV